MAKKEINFVTNMESKTSVPLFTAEILLIPEFPCRKGIRTSRQYSSRNSRACASVLGDSASETQETHQIM